MAQSRLTASASILAIAALALFFFYTLWFQQGRAFADLTGEEAVTVHLTERGFEPEIAYVSRGARVTFVSDRSGQFWPASDLHPFHTIYRAFDPSRPLEEGESWSFVFDKDGHWSYHDHIDPTITGAIIVVPPGESADAKFDVIAECDQPEADGRQACWKQQILFDLESRGLDVAFDRVERIYGEHNDFARDCHLFVHDLGLLAYGKYEEKVPLSDKMRTCGQGFWHGYMEGFLSRNEGDVGAASAFCERVGEHFGDDSPLSGPQCHHGIGHGYMEYILSTRPDLMHDLPALVELGVSDCAQLPNDDTRFRCASGVFAVTKDWINIQGLQERYKDYFSVSEPFSLCQDFAEEWVIRACAWELSKQLYLMTGRDARATFAAQIPAGLAWRVDLVPFMVTSAAFLVGELGVTLDDDVLARSCAGIAQREFRTACIQGIESGLLFNGKPDGAEVERSAQFCRHEQFTQAEREACEHTLVTYMADAYGAEGLRSACGALTSLDPMEVGCKSEL